MIRPLLSRLTRFARGEEGSMVIPVALWTPVFLTLILATIELGTLTMRDTNLERAVDQTVRELRLGTGTIRTHADLKQSICDKAGSLPHCTETLQLEMLRMSMRDWVDVPAVADCVDVSQEVNPVRNLQFGGNHEMMLIRACYKYRPITPAGWMGQALGKDNQGLTGLIATSAFVQEPQS